MSRAKIDPTEKVLNLFLDLPKDEARALHKTLGVLMKRDAEVVSLRKRSLHHAMPVAEAAPTAPTRRPRRRAAPADPGPVAEVGG